MEGSHPFNIYEALSETLGWPGLDRLLFAEATIIGRLVEFVCSRRLPVIARQATSIFFFSGGRDVTVISALRAE